MKEEEEEEEVESDGEGTEEGSEVVRVEKVVLAHELYTSSASCFCSACRRREYNECFTNSMYPGQAPALKAGEVEETVVRVTGVDPVVGVNPKQARYQEKTESNRFRQGGFLHDEKGTWHAVWRFFLREHVE